MGKRRPSPTQREAKRRSHLSEPEVKIKPDASMIIWCPYCDWRNSDSFTGRRRLGNHVVNDHPQDVLYSQDEEPDDFEE